MTTKVEICRKSLMILGAKPIQSLEEDNSKARLCSEFYPDKKRTALSETHWNFATKKRQLNQLTEEPKTEWDYQYQMPSNKVAGPHSVFFDKNSDTTLQNYEVVNGKLMANRDTIYIDYTFDADENRFPPYFVDFLTYALAAELAKPITDQTTEAQRLYQIAYGSESDNEEGGKLGKAKRRDSQGQATQVIQDDPLTEARFS